MRYFTSNKKKLISKSLDVSFCYKNEKCNKEIKLIDIFKRNNVFIESIAQETTSKN